MSEIAVIEIPKGWEEKTVSDVIKESQIGIVRSRAQQNYDGKGAAYLKMNNVTWDGRITNDDIVYVEVTEEELIRYQIKEGDILFNTRNSSELVGKTGFANKSVEGYIYNNNLMRIRVEDNVDSKFIAYQMISPKFRRDMEKVKRATTNIAAVYAKDLLPLPVVSAPLEQQKRIVSKIEELFSHIDAGIEALNKAKQLLKQYRQSVLKAAVTGKLTEQWRADRAAELDAQGRANAAGAGSAGAATKDETAQELLDRILQERRQKWEEQQLEQFKAKGKMPKNDKWKEKYKVPVLPDEKRIHDLPSSWCWGTYEQVSGRVTVGHVGSMKNEYIEKGVPFLRSQNVRENRYDSKGLKFVSEAFHKKLQKSSLEPGDLVTVRSGSVGVTCVIPEYLEVANCSDLVIVKKPKAVNSKYAAYYMNTITQTKVAAQKVGVALTHFNTKSMAEMPLPVPPLLEQEQIVALVDMKISDVEKLEEVIGEQLKKAEKNKQSILASVFSGGILNAM
jgi:type I restriction enzyme S subunit